LDRTQTMGPEDAGLSDGLKKVKERLSRVKCVRTRVRPYQAMQRRNYLSFVASYVVIKVSLK